MLNLKKKQPPVAEFSLKFIFYATDVFIFFFAENFSKENYLFLTKNKLYYTFLQFCLSDKIVIYKIVVKTASIHDIFVIISPDFL